MEVKITKKLAEAVGRKPFKQFDIEEDSWGWKEGATLDIARMSKKQVETLRLLIVPFKQIPGASIVLRDIDTWNRALKDGAGGQKARKVRQFEPLLAKFLQGVPGHRLYKRGDDLGETFLAYYVTKIGYEPPDIRNGYNRPAYVWMKVAYEEFGGRKEFRVVFNEEDCRSIPVIEALARKGYYAETPEYREQYLKESKRFGEVCSKVGKQFLASGTAVDDLDGNPKGRDGSWYWNQTHTVQMEREGQPTRVAVDVYYEDDKSDRDKEDRVDLHSWFWTSVANNQHVADDEDEDSNAEEAISDEVEEVPVIEVPIHPKVAVFDLAKHLRLRIHVNYLKEYEYEPHMDSKLVLPDKLKTLVRMLLEHKGAGFKDIVKGKSGGAVVLLTGPPGVGKTLTAEVYAEHEQRVLYSVQCSQLGTDPSDLEDELLKVFARARRWNAVMLLDEADVYVRERGSDLHQNAIVGVFLRVLEYQSSVLFFTTNRPKDVDDAIASRCIARIDYPIPSPKEQTQIWAILSAVAGIKMGPGAIAEIVKNSSGITGRDVKNLLKLAQLVAASEGSKAITAEAVEFVKQFKPTTKG